MATEKVTYRPEGQRARTIYLENVQEATFMGAPTLTGREVTREGDHVFGTTQAVERLHVIEQSLIIKRVPVVMDNIYGEFVEVDRK